LVVILAPGMGGWTGAGMLGQALCLASKDVLCYNLAYTISSPRGDPWQEIKRLTKRQ
jgi:hypothetical protein